MPENRLNRTYCGMSLQKILLKGRETCLHTPETEAGIRPELPDFAKKKGYERPGRKK